MENKTEKKILTGAKADNLEMEQHKARLTVLLERMDRMQAMLKMLKINKPKPSDQEIDEP